MRNSLTPLARTMRANPTAAERRLWHYLRQRPFGFKFRRQFPIGSYIVDFASIQAYLIIEVDGGFHANQPADVARDAWLTAQGWEVTRYWNDEVRFDADGVIADIERRLQER